MAKSGPHWTASLCDSIHEDYNRNSSWLFKVFLAEKVRV